MFTINKPPRGLLELFRLRTGGGTPSGFQEYIQPVSVVDDFYGAETLLNTSVAGAAGAFPRQATLATPFGSPVRVHGVAAELIFGAGATAGSYYFGSVGWQDLSGVVFPIFAFAHFPNVGTAIAAGSVLNVGGQLPYPRVVPAGTNFIAAWASNDAAATHNARLQLHFENIIL